MYGDVCRIKLYNPAERLCKVFGSLIGKACDKIHVDRFEPHGLRHLIYAHDIFGGMFPVKPGQGIRVHRLRIDADPRDTVFAHRQELVFRDRVRTPRLDRHFAVPVYGDLGIHAVKERSEFRLRKHRRRAASDIDRADPSSNPRRQEPYL